MEREMEAPGFWDDPERSNQKMKELKNLKDTVGECDKLSTQYDDILTPVSYTHLDVYKRQVAASFQEPSAVP